MGLVKDVQNRIIGLDHSILQAIKKMDDLAVKSLIVAQGNNKLSGILSIGDIQRAIIKSVPLDSPVSDILRPNPRVLYEDPGPEKVKELLLSHRMEFIPLVDPVSKQITKIYNWSDFFQDLVMAPAKQFNLPVVVMAGGMGTRLRPLTNVIPKPLIPMGNKTMIEQIFDNFSRFGCTTFYISVNYKADLIDYYLKEQNLGYHLHYFREDQPLGTAGSLSMLKGKISQTFFVTNCDILIEQDYADILQYHRDSSNEITVVAALKHFPIPYGIIETGENGYLKELIEKPELTFKINSGMYILEPHLINEIPEDEFFHITSLIENILKRNGRVGVFPVSQGSWVDIGTFQDYQNQLTYKSK